MRVGFTIVHEGDHHLRHNDYAERLAGMLDQWVVVEGVADPGGSTSWCNRIDGAVVKQRSETWPLKTIRGNVIIRGASNRRWDSKDRMVNVALASIVKIPGIVNNLFLWQVDVDEQWTAEQMAAAEKELIEKNGDCGCFHANHFVGKDLAVKGCWGEGNDPADPLKNAYRRLWRWKGQKFKTHEPPVLEGGNGKEILLSQRFNHYSYFFEKDIIFKAKYYKGYEDLHEKWLSLQDETEFPQPISRLINGYWGQTDTQIVKV